MIFNISVLKDDESYGELLEFLNADNFKIVRSNRLHSGFSNAYSIRYVHSRTTYVRI